MVKVITDISECCSPRGCTNTVKGVYNLLGGYVRSASASYVTPDYAFIDNFNSDTEVPLTDHVPNIGGAWTVESGIPSVANGYLTLERISPSDRRVVITNDLGVSNATILFDMVFTFDFESGMTIEFNIEDANNHWAVYHSPPYMWLFEHTDGVQTTRDTYIGQIGYTTMMLEIITDGDTITVYKDGNEILTYTTDNRPHQNGTGLRIDWFKNSGTIQFNKISALPPFNPP